MNRPLWTYEELDQKIVQKLNSNGFHSKEDVEKNVEAAKKICENIHSVLNEKINCTWKYCHEILQEEKQKQYITTLSKYLDDLLNGGLELGKLTEIYGNSGSGKTQLCMQLAINVTLPQLLGGLEGESVYIETSKSVFPCRLVEMVNAFVDHVIINVELKKKMKACQSEQTEIGRNTHHKHGKETSEAIQMDVENDFNSRKRKNNHYIHGNKEDLAPSLTKTRCEENQHMIVRGEHSLAKETAEVKGETRNRKTIQKHHSNENRLDTLDATLEGVPHRAEPATDLPTSSKRVNNGTETPSKEFKVNMTRTDLAKLINQSKQSNTNLNQFLHTKMSSVNQTEVSRDSILSKIHLHYCANYYEVLALVMNIEKHLQSKKPSKIKLIVIDNATFLFHSEDDSNYLKRTKHVYYLLNLLSDLARTHNLSVVVINQLTTKYEREKRKVVSALGETFAHRMQVRLLMQRFTSAGARVGLGDHATDMEDESQLFMCFIDKMNVHNAEMRDKMHVVFQINEQGVRDV